MLYKTSKSNYVSHDHSTTKQNMMISNIAPQKLSTADNKRKIFIRHMLFNSLTQQIDSVDLSISPQKMHRLETSRCQLTHKGHNFLYAFQPSQEKSVMILLLIVFIIVL